MSKAKNKKPGKSGKLDPRNVDLSELQKPIKISVSSLKEAAKLLETGSPEVKDLLSYEVNLLYECRICRSIFRSLLNLISHKRSFCREKFNGSGHRSRNYANCENITTENLENSEFDQFTLDSLVNASKNDRILRSQAPVKTTKTDLTSVVHMLKKKQVEQLGDVTIETSELPVEENDCDQVVLQILDTKRAAYQTVVQRNSASDDLMENQVIELENILNQDSVVLRADGQIEKSDSPVHFYGVDENRLVCDICSLSFITQRTFDSHFRIKHAAVRDCYLCPTNSCTASFSSTMGVKRHLTNVHRKVGQELKSLSQQIEKRTVRSRPLSVVVNKKTKKPENSDDSVDNSMETQQWVERIDSQALHECISCGEKFNGKSELVIHLKHCLGADQERINDIIYEDDPELKANMIKEIREIPVLNLSNEEQPDSSSKTMPDITSEKQGLSIRIQDISKITEEDWRKTPGKIFESEDIIEEIQPKFDNSRGISFVAKKNNKPLITENVVLIGNFFDHSRKRKAISNEANIAVTGEKLKKLPYNENETEKATTKKLSSQQISDTIASISDHDKLKCIACRLSFSNISSLNRHMENHIKMNRFQCNKCDFKSPIRNDCVGHCNRVHNAMNRRQVLNEMISEVSQDQSQETITVNPSNLNSSDAKRANVGSQFGNNNNSTTNLLHTRSNAIKNSEVRNPSDTDTEPEDREAIRRRIDSNPNLQEMIREIVGTNSTPAASTSNVNGPSSLPNKTVDRLRNDRTTDYSPDYRNSEFNNIFPPEDDEIYEELDQWDRKSNLSRASNRSESRMRLRSTSRLSAKLVTDDEDDITPELYAGKMDNARRSPRCQSRSSIQSSSQTMETNELRRVTRSQSRLSNKLSEEVDVSWFEPVYAERRDENKVKRPRSRAKKEEVKEKRGRGRPRKNERRSAPGKINVNKNAESSTSRRESFSSESSQNQRPVRSRVKHVEKDFIYDLENENFVKTQKSGHSQFAQNGNSSNSNFRKEAFFNDSDEDLTIIQAADSNAEMENSDPEFLGFPPSKPEVLSIE